MTRALLLVALGAAVTVAPLTAQTDREERLSEALPPHALAAVLDDMAEARLLGLPADAIALRALELTAKGATPDEVVERVAMFADRLAAAAAALREDGGFGVPAADIVAGADALGSGLTPRQLRSVAAGDATSEPLLTRLIVVTGLVDRGVPPTDAVATIVARGTMPARPPHPATAAAANPESPPLVPAAAGSRRRVPITRPGFPPLPQIPPVS